MMKMYFNFDRNFTLLFKGWKIVSDSELVVACTLMVLLGISYEALKFFRVYLIPPRHRQEETPCQPKEMVHHVSYGAIEVEVETRSTNRSTKPRMLSWRHMLQTLLHMIQVFIAYLLMFSFMTYNTWICVSVILGFGLGYYLLDSLTLPKCSNT